MITTIQFDYSKNHHLQQQERQCDDDGAHRAMINGLALAQYMLGNGHQIGLEVIEPNG